MSDREFMTAVYKAVEAVFERLTGEHLVVRVPINGGQDTVSFKSLGDFLEDRSVGDNFS